LDEVLPALTSNAHVDLELYALIAVIFRDFVHKWYLQITNDVAFVEEVIVVIAHVTRALETRLRKVTFFPTRGANVGRSTWRLLF
jgi:PXA domain